MHDNQLTNLLKRMDVPTYRKNSFNLGNLTWFMRNLGIRNSEHPNYEKVINEIKRRIREKDYVN